MNLRETDEKTPTLPNMQMVPLIQQRVKQESSFKPKIETERDAYYIHDYQGNLAEILFNHQSQKYYEKESEKEANILVKSRLDNTNMQ